MFGYHTFLAPETFIVRVRNYVMLISPSCLFNMQSTFSLLSCKSQLRYGNVPATQLFSPVLGRTIFLFRLKSMRKCWSRGYILATYFL